MIILFPPLFDNDLSLLQFVGCICFRLCVFGGGMIAMRVAYGSSNPELPEATFIRILPLLAVLYSRLLWWPLWSLTEELTCNGYALPRLKAITKSLWLSVALVGFFLVYPTQFLAVGQSSAWVISFPHVCTTDACFATHLPARSPSHAAHYRTLVDGSGFGLIHASDWIRSDPIVTW